MDPESANTAKVTKLLENRYMKNFNDKIANLRGLIDMCSECIFVAPTLGTAEKVREAGNKVNILKILSSNLFYIMFWIHIYVKGCGTRQNGTLTERMYILIAKPRSDRLAGPKGSCSGISTF